MKQYPFFYEKQCLYQPQKRIHTGKKVANKIGENAKWFKTMAADPSKSKPLAYKDDGTRHPLQILKFSRDNMIKRLHPTQKPVALMEYLIKTYTNEGDTVLDFTMGSGTTGFACKNLNRDFIGIELDDKYFQIAKKRIEEKED